MRLILFFILIGLVLSQIYSCRRTRCVNPDLYDSLKIELITKSELPKIVNDTFVYRKGNGDSAIVVCTKMETNFDDQKSTSGDIDCPQTKHLITEHLNYFFTSKNLFFNNLSMSIYKSESGFKLADLIFVKESDFLIDSRNWANLSITLVDSQMVNSNFIRGNYFSHGKVLFNKEIGILKINYQDSIEWTLISKTY